MSKNPLTPAIRFSGFTDAWERRQLGEIAQVRTGYPFDSMDFADKGEFLVVTNGNIQDDNPCVDNSQGNHIDVTDNRIISQYVLDIGDILVTMDGTVGRTAKVAHNQMILAQRVGRLTSYGNEEFLYQALTSGNFSETMTSLSHGGTIKHISLSEISNYNLFLPEDEIEQKKVGLLFQRVDSLITLHQRKYEKLVNLKKAMLDKMFPKNGELVPEVRFAGFSGNWERREMGDIVTEYNDPVATPTTGYYRLGIRSFGKGTFHSFVEPGMGLQTGQMHRVAADKFIVNITFGWEHAVAITTDRDEGKLVSHRFPQFSFAEGMVPSFFKFLILDESFKHHLWLASPGGAGRNRVLKISDMLEYQFWVTSKEEQSEVALFLERVDNLIELQRQKVLRIQNLKKAFLEKMFV